MVGMFKTCFGCFVLSYCEGDFPIETAAPFLVDRHLVLKGTDVDGRHLSYWNTSPGL